MLVLVEMELAEDHDVEGDGAGAADNVAQLLEQELSRVRLSQGCTQDRARVQEVPAQGRAEEHDGHPLDRPPAVVLVDLGDPRHDVHRGGEVREAVPQIERRALRLRANWGGRRPAQRACDRGERHERPQPLAERDGVRLAVRVVVLAPNRLLHHRDLIVLLLAGVEVVLDAQNEVHAAVVAAQDRLEPELAGHDTPQEP